jgi:hypothetical protein
MIVETVTLGCACGRHVSWTSVGAEVDIAGLLRGAIRAGWRRIDDEQTNTICSTDGTEVQIYLAGQCDKCTGNEERFRDIHAARIQRARKVL